MCSKEIEKNPIYSKSQYEGAVYCGRACFFDDKRYDIDDMKASFYRRTIQLDNGCIEWIGGKCEKGYGLFSMNGKTIRAHRAAWFFKNGEMIPNNKMACHKCDNPSCVNADHIFIGTAKDNYDDMVKKGRGRNLSGFDLPFSKFKRSDIELICKGNMTAPLLAKRLNVSESAIRSVRNGQNWRHETEKYREEMNNKYYKFLRTLSCAKCGATHHHEPIQVCHIRIGSCAGIGRKPDDDRVIPMCHNCHRHSHQIGELSFYDDVFKAQKLARDLYEIYHDVDKETRSQKNSSDSKLKRAKVNAEIAVQRFRNDI